MSLEIKAKPGDDVTLECQGPRDGTITLLEWSRPELKPDALIFFYRNNRSYASYQRESYRGRVELSEKSSVKDGDVSVVLKNVTRNDTGSYKCRIIILIVTIPGERTTSELSQLINLTVTDSGDTAENTWEDGEEDEKERERKDSSDGESSGLRSRWVTAGPACLAVVLLGFIVCIAVINYRKTQRPKKKDSCKPSAKHESV